MRCSSASARSEMVSVARSGSCMPGHLARTRGRCGRRYRHRVARCVVPTHGERVRTRRGGVPHEARVARNIVHGSYGGVFGGRVLAIDAPVGPLAVAPYGKPRATRITGRHSADRAEPRRGVGTRSRPRSRRIEQARAFELFGDRTKALRPDDGRLSMWV